jgi:hypothetical protein
LHISTGRRTDHRFRKLNRITTTMAAQKVFGVAELLDEMLGPLTPYEILRARQVCKTWYFSVNNSTVLRRKSWLSPSESPASFTITVGEHPDVQARELLTSNYIDYQHLHPLLVAKLDGFVQRRYSTVPAAILLGDNGELIFATSALSFLMNFVVFAYKWVPREASCSWLLEPLTRPATKKLNVCWLPKKDVVRLEVNDAVTLKDFLNTIRLIDYYGRRFPRVGGTMNTNREKLETVLRQYSSGAW